MFLACHWYWCQWHANATGDLPHGLLHSIALLIELHRLPVAARIKLKLLVTHTGLLGTGWICCLSLEQSPFCLPHTSGLAKPPAQVLQYSPHTLFPNGGTTSRTLSEQGQPSTPSKSSWRHNFSPDSTYLSPPRSVSPVYLPLHSFSIALHC